MTYKQIEASREMRLWITQVIVPATLMVATVFATVPEARYAAAEKFNNVKRAVKNKFKK